MVFVSLKSDPDLWSSFVSIMINELRVVTKQQKQQKPEFRPV